MTGIKFEYDFFDIYLPVTTICQRCYDQSTGITEVLISVCKMSTDHPGHHVVVLLVTIKEIIGEYIITVTEKRRCNIE